MLRRQLPPLDLHHRHLARFLLSIDCRRTRQLKATDICAVPSRCFPPVFLTAILASATTAKSLIGEQKLHSHCAVCHGAGGHRSRSPVSLHRADCETYPQSARVFPDIKARHGLCLCQRQVTANCSRSSVIVRDVVHMVVLLSRHIFMSFSLPACTRRRLISARCGSAPQPVIDRTTQSDLRHRRHGDPCRAHRIQLMQAVEQPRCRFMQIAGF